VEDVGKVHHLTLEDDFSVSAKIQIEKSTRGFVTAFVLEYCKIENKEDLPAFGRIDVN
jgi:hypothetical protein